MVEIRKHLLAGAASIGMMVAGATSGLAGPLELNPDSTNNGTTVALDQTCNPCASYPFFTNNSNTAFTSDLHINGTPGSAGTQTATETGSILITTFNVLAPPGGQSNITDNYNIYATFSISGTGTWSGTAFTINGPVSAGITLVGSPNNNAGAPFTAIASGLNFTTPTAGTFGVMPGNEDFNLGTAALVAALLAPQAGGTCSGSGDCIGLGTTTFNGIFDFSPAANTTGANGFFVNLTGPFQLTIGGQQGGNPLNTTETVSGGMTDFVTVVTTGGCTGTGFSGNCPAGGGSLSYDVAAVPEPASLTLLGAGLLGFGFLARRRRRNHQNHKLVA